MYTMWQCPHLFLVCAPQLRTVCASRAVCGTKSNCTTESDSISWEIFRWCNGLQLSDRFSERRKKRNLIESSTYFFSPRKWENIWFGIEWAMTAFWLRFNWHNFPSLSTLEANKSLKLIQNDQSGNRYHHRRRRYHQSTKSYAEKFTDAPTVIWPRVR